MTTINDRCLMPTIVVATHHGFTLWRMLESNQRLIVFTTKLILHMVERTGIKPVPVATLDDHAYVTPSLDILPPCDISCHIIHSPKDCNLGDFLFVYVYTHRR